MSSSMEYFVNGSLGNKCIDFDIQVIAFLYLSNKKKRQPRTKIQSKSKKADHHLDKTILEKSKQCLVHNYNLNECVSHAFAALKVRVDRA